MREKTRGNVSTEQRRVPSTLPPGSYVARDDDGDPIPLLVVARVVDSGLSEFTTATLAHSRAGGPWVTALSHQGPSTAGVVRVLQQDRRGGAELRLATDVQLVRK